jgi:hypothetical protein
MWIIVISDAILKKYFSIKNILKNDIFLKYFILIY